MSLFHSTTGSQKRMPHKASVPRSKGTGTAWGGVAMIGGLVFHRRYSFPKSSTTYLCFSPSSSSSPPPPPSPPLSLSPAPAHPLLRAHVHSPTAFRSTHCCWMPALSLTSPSLLHALSLLSSRMCLPVRHTTPQLPTSLLCTPSTCHQKMLVRRTGGWDES